MLKLKISQNTADIVDDHGNIVAVISVRELDDRSLEVVIDKQETRAVKVDIR